MKPSCVLLILASIFVTSISQAQLPTVPQYEHLKGLEPFVGQWQGRYDPPGDVPIGMCRVSAKWTGFKSYVRFEVTFVPDGTEIVLNPMDIVIGYNGETKSPYAWNFGSISQSAAIAKISENKIVMESEGVDFRGDTRSRTTTYELRSADEMVVTNTNIQRNGEPQPDDDVLVLSKLTEQNASDQN